MSHPSPAPARVLLSGAILVAFHRLFRDGQELLSWDDAANLIQNEGYKGLDTAHLAWMFEHAQLAVYEPFSWLLKAVEYAAFGLSARGFHLVTLALHVASAFLVQDLARRLISHAWVSARAAQVRAAALGAALLFAVHPLRVEVVAWASGQSYALAGLFFLLSLSAYVRYAEGTNTGEPGTKSRLRTHGHWLALSLAAYIAAGLSKSAAVMLPLVLVVLDLYPLRRRLTPRVILEKAPFFVVLVALFLLAIQANTHGDQASGTLDPEQRLARALQAPVFYVAKTLWPAGLAAFYPVQPERLSLLAPETLLSGAVLAAALTVAWQRRGSSPWIGAVLMSYIVTLLPVLGFVSHGEPTMACDRYAYMGTLGLDLLLAVGLARLWGSPAATTGRRAAFGLLALLTGLTIAQTGCWYTTATLWRSALTVTHESAFVLNNLGYDLMEAERWSDAEPLLARAVTLQPGDARAALNYGVTLEKLGRVDEATSFYMRATRSLPDAAALYFNLGALLVRQRRVDSARDAFEQAARLRPSWSAPREMLARLPRTAAPSTTR
jgi:tetratricopeptide (TPR) repeat protein